jgi:CRISPR-associated protein Csb2
MSMNPTVARFAVTGQTPPRLTETIFLADRVHAALVSLSDGSSIFTGCDDQGKPLQGHRHAHFFCESNVGLGKGANGEITHVTVYAPMGFSPEDQEALAGLRAI